MGGPGAAKALSTPARTISIRPSCSRSDCLPVTSSSSERLPGKGCWRSASLASFAWTWAFEGVYTGVVISRARRHRYSYSEYLVLEAGSSVRHEFADGEIYAMAGGTPTHAALAATIIRLVGARLPFGCRAYSSDLRVRVSETGLSTYPDVTVVCGQTARAADDPVAVT